MPSAAIAGWTCSAKTRELTGRQLVGARADLLEHLTRAQTRRGGHGDPGRDPPLEPGDPDHEELVEVRGEDCEEADPFEQRLVRVLGKLEDSLVEREPADLAVEEAVLGQRYAFGDLVLGLRQVRVVGRDVLGDVGGQLRRERAAAAQALDHLLGGLAVDRTGDLVDDRCDHEIGPTRRARGTRSRRAGRTRRTHSGGPRGCGVGHRPIVPLVGGLAVPDGRADPEPNITSTALRSKPARV
jgi:hypothetical protein